MIKKIIATSLVAATLIFSGCGNDGEDALSAQQKLDQRDFLGAISILEGDANTDAEKMKLGSAYMGAASLSNTDLIKLMSDSTDNNTSSGASAAPMRADSTSNDTGSFAQFADKLQNIAENNPRMLEFLEKATAIFEKVTTQKESKSVGFSIGLANTAKATATLSYLGDIEAMVSGGIDGELDASACAMTWMYANQYGKKCESFDIRKEGTNGLPYDMMVIRLKADVNNTTEYSRIVSGTPGSGEMYLHENYTNTLGEVFKEWEDGTNYPKAVLINGEKITIQATLVDALNKGFDTILEFAPDDTKDDIKEYRQEIDSNNDGQVSAEEVSEYIEAESDKER